MPPTALGAPLRIERSISRRSISRRSISSSLAPWIIALAAPIVAYALFVVHYGVNAIYWDDWTVVPIVNSALHGHLSFSQLWAQHNENRLLLPNLLFIGFAWLDHLDMRTVMVADMVVYAASWLGLVHLYGRYARRRLGIVPTLVLGVVWFGFEDWQNALWAFQLAWFLIVLLLVAMLFVLSAETLRPWHLAVAGALAFAASISSLQGLLLWPIGLLCLAWRIPASRRLAVLGGWWTAAAALTTALYLSGYNFQQNGAGPNSISYGLHHLGLAARYLLVEIGYVMAPAHLSLPTFEILGFVALVGALWAVTSCLRGGRTRFGLVPLPAALIMFGLCFDVLTAVGRVKIGVGEATASRYSMANILVLAGIATQVFATVVPLPAGIARRRPIAWRTALALAPVGAVVILLAVQAGVADDTGLASAQTIHYQRELDARITVNIREPVLAHESDLVRDYVYPDTDFLLGAAAEARADGLAEFSPPLRRLYESMGFPGGYGYPIPPKPRHSSQLRPLTLRPVVSTGAKQHSMATVPIGWTRLL